MDSHEDSLSLSTKQVCITAIAFVAIVAVIIWVFADWYGVKFALLMLLMMVELISGLVIVGAYVASQMLSRESRGAKLAVSLFYAAGAVAYLICIAIVALYRDAL